MAEPKPRHSGSLEGYAFPTGVSKIQPIYYPSIHQIWIPYTVPENILPLVRAHEAMHVCTISFQPPQFIPLSLRLGGAPERVGKNHFKDVVETVCEACLWAQTNLSVDDIPSAVKSSQHQKALARLFELSLSLAEQDSQTKRGERVLKEVVIGMCMLLMHTIPLQPASSLRILKIISDIAEGQKYSDRWQLLYSLHSQLSEQWNNSLDIQKAIILSLPMDIHRFILDLVMFSSLIINCITISRQVVTSAFPALLGILTLGGFELLPFIYLQESNGRYAVVLDIIHTTTTRHADPLAYVQAKCSTADTNSRNRTDCVAIPITQAIERASKKYMFSDCPDRTWRCFDALLTLLPDLLKAYLLKECSCPRCTVRFFKNESFKKACNSIINMPNQIKKQLVESARSYEQYLRQNSIQHMKYVWGLPSSLEVVQRFKFL